MYRKYMERNSLDIPVSPVGFPGGSGGKESACSAGDLGSIPRLGRSPWEGNVNALQYSSLGTPMDRGAWWITVHGVAKSLTQLKRLSTHTCILTPCLEWVMTPHRCLFSLFEYILREHRIWVKIQIYSIFVVTKYIEKRSTVFLIAEEFLLYLTY